MGPPDPTANHPAENALIGAALINKQVRCGTGWPAIDAARLAVDLPRWPLLLVAVCLLRRRGAVHNLIAHPLLTLCPPVGEWLHGRTAP